MEKETIIYLDGFADGLNMANNSTNKMLDKLRAEIIELRSRQNVGVLECLDIIDKYKVESESQDEFRYGMERCIDIIAKAKAEIEPQESEDKE